MEIIKNTIGNEVKVFAETFENEAYEQVKALANFEPYQNAKIRIMPDSHAGKGCTIGTTMTITDKITPNLTGVDIGCLDCDTEVLTPNGWIKISDYNGQKIMQIDPKTDEGKFIQPTAFIKEKCDWFYHFKNSKGMDQMISEEHNMLVYSGQRNLKFCKKNPDFFVDKDNLIKGYYRFNTCFNVISHGIDLSDNMIRIDAMVQADGRIREHDDYNFVELHFRKERKIERAKVLLHKDHISFNEYLLKDGSMNITFRIEKVINKDLTKYWNANFHQLKILSEECLLWDGYKGYRSFYSSTSKSNVDVIQYAFIATNTRASIYCNKSDNRNKWNNCFNVIPTKNKFVGYTQQPSIVKSSDGYKYCFTTSTGYFICRRNDYTFITGNCGMLVVEIREREINLKELDNVIHEHVPSGFNIHLTPIHSFDFKNLRCVEHVNLERAILSIGSLGGGNHFIEVDRSEDGRLYLVIHSGSRNLGVGVCNYYQSLAYANLSSLADKKKELIAVLKAQGREKDINSELQKLSQPKFIKELAYLEGEDFEDYINDMEIVQQFASLNRKTIAELILGHTGLHVVSTFETIHNYIDTKHMILRKGAVSAQKGEKFIVPINMRDGSLICIGKGNEDWNCSAPHGAGRLMSRSKAKETVSMNEYQRSMEGVYTTSVNDSTIDEAPQVYKPISEIMKAIEPTADIVEVIKPIYNYKAN